MSEPAAPISPAAHDFDFLLGSWIVQHRRLENRLKGDTRWQTFGGTMSARPILLGQGNFDENVIDLPSGAYQACTLRIFHPPTEQWTIHWIDGRDPKLDDPMTGGFFKGVGLFHGDSELKGVPIKVRFVWSRITPQSAAWEQSFSNDGGASWEPNWVMEFTRT